MCVTIDVVRKWESKLLMMVVDPDEEEDGVWSVAVPFCAFEVLKNA